MKNNIVISEIAAIYLFVSLIIDYDAIEVTFETDILNLQEEWPKNKPRHSGISVNFRCMKGNSTSPFPYSTRFLGTDEFEYSHYDPLRWVSKLMFA